MQERRVTASEASLRDRAAAAGRSSSGDRPATRRCSCSRPRSPRRDAEGSTSSPLNQQRVGIAGSWQRPRRVPVPVRHVAVA